MATSNFTKNYLARRALRGNDPARPRTLKGAEGLSLPTPDDNGETETQTVRRNSTEKQKTFSSNYLKMRERRVTAPEGATASDVRDRKAETGKQGTAGQYDPENARKRLEELTKQTESAKRERDKAYLLSALDQYASPQKVQENMAAYGAARDRYNELEKQRTELLAEIEESTGRTGGQTVRTGPGTAGHPFQSQAAQPLDQENSGSTEDRLRELKEQLDQAKDEEAAAWNAMQGPGARDRSAAETAALERRQTEAKARADALQAQYDELSTGFWDRVRDTILGGGEGSLASTANAAAALYEMGQGGRDARTQETIEEYQAQYEREKQLLDTMRETAKNDPERAAGYEGVLENQESLVEDLERKLKGLGASTEAQKGATQATYGLADEMAEESQRRLENAKSGLGGLGRLAVDAGANAVQMGGDIAAGLATGTGTLLPMALRSFGGGAQSARQDGADAEQAALYGAGSALVEVLTEKMFSVGRFQTAAFGSGSMDDILEGVVGAVERMGKTKLGREALNRLATAGTGFLTEAAEEIVSGMVDPILQRATYSKEPIDWKETISDALYDGLVGGVTGMIGGIGGTDTSGIEQSFQTELRRQLQGEDTQGGAETAQTGPEAAGGIQAPPAAEGPQIGSEGVLERPGGANETSGTNTPTATPTNTPAESTAAPEAARPLPDLGAVKSMTDRMVRGGADQETAARLGLLLARAQAGQTLTGQEMAEIQGNRTATGALMAIEALRARQNEAARTASRETDRAEMPRVSMEDFTDRESQVWNNVDYNDSQTRENIQQSVHQEMVNAGQVVQVPDSTVQQVAESYPDLRSMKKSERTGILKEKIGQLKTSLRQFLNGLKGSSYEFEVNGNVLEAKLYDTGVREVMEKISQDKAAMLYETENIFRNARYLYSTQDYEGDPNIYRWNYFYTPVQIGDQTMGVRIAVRDMVPSADGKMDSQIYNWGIKKNAPLDGGGPGLNPNTTGVSSGASSDATLGGGERGVSPDRSGASSAVSEASIAQGNQNVNQPAEGLSLPAPDDYQNGGTSDGAEQGGNVLSGRGQGRVAGPGAGEQAGGLAEGAGGRTAAADQGRAAIGRQDLAKDLRGQRQSAQELGIPGGTEARSLTVLPEDRWDQRQRTLAKQVYEETGKQVQYVLGSISIRTSDGGTARVRGVYMQDRIVIQADNMRVTIEQIADHEIFHDKAFQTPGLIWDIENQIRERYGPEELRRVLESYYQNLRGIVDVTEDMDGDAMEKADRDVLEEIFADAYAKINAFGAHAERLNAGVEQAMEDRGVGRSRETAEATDRTTGPPEGRYSFAGRNARGADSEALAKAEQMEYQGVDPEDIWRETGWTRGMDGLWRFEIDDSGMTYSRFGDARFRQDHPEYQRYQELTNRYIQGDITQEEAGELRELGQTWGRELPRLNERVNRGAATLENLIRHDELFRNYPQLRNTRVQFRDLRPGERGSYSPDTDTITLREDLRRAPEDTLIHEIQHAIQQAEGFTPGASLEYWEGNAAAQQRQQAVDRIQSEIDGLREMLKADEDAEDADFIRNDIEELEEKLRDLNFHLYENTAGEIEARDAAARRNLTAEQRRETAPDRGDENTVFAGQGEESFSVEETPDGERIAVINEGQESNTQNQEEFQGLSLPTLEEDSGARFSVDEDQATEDNAQETERRGAQTARGTARREEGNRPTYAKQDLRRSLNALFSVPEGQRAEANAAIDQFADKLLRNGTLTEKDRQDFFDRMYESGVMTVEAPEDARAGRDAVKGGRIYVNDAIRADFGEDWNDFRKRAFAAGVYLTGNSGDAGVDVWNSELGEMLPGIFNRNETDGAAALERIVQIAEEGQDERLSLKEYTAMLAGREGVSERELLRDMERQMDWALRTFAEKAGLEVRLKDRSDRQRARDAARRQEKAQRARADRELREMQQKTLKQLQWLSKNRSRAPQELQARWDEVLGDIDIYAVSAANEMRWSKRHQATWRDLAEMYKDAQKNDPNFLPSKEMERIVARLDGEKIADMDPDALADLYRAAVGIRTEFYNRNNVINDELGRQFAEVYEGSKEEIQNAAGGYRENLIDKAVNEEQLTPMNMLERMGGWDPEGTFYSMAKQLEQGERRSRDYQVRAKRTLEDFLRDNADWVAKADGQGKDAIWYELEVPELLELRMGDKPIFGDTVKVYMTPSQKVHLYLESRNTDNLRHMTGGRTFADKELYSQGKRTEAFAQGKTIKLAPETVKRIVSDLTEEEMALAKVLDAYYNGFAAGEINRVSNTLYGYDKAMSRAYAPIYTNKNYTKSEIGVYDATAEGVGNLKARQYAVNPSYNIGAFDAFEKHVDQTAKFVGMAIPARNWNTLLNWRESDNGMRDVISHKWGEAGKSYIDDLLAELQGGKSVDRKSVFDRAMNTALSQYISSVFGANPGIVFKQAMSFPLGATYLGWENMPNIAAALRTDDSLINTYTSELAYRLLGYATPETAQLKNAPGWIQRNKAANFTLGGGAITAMDGWTVKSMWRWAENAVRRDSPDLETGSQEVVDAGQSPFYQEVARRFEEAVSRSQPMYDVMHRSNIMRSPSGIARALTLFKTVPQQQYNMLRQAAGEAAYYKKAGMEAEHRTAAKRAGRAVLGVVVAGLGLEAVNFLNAMLKNKAKWYRDDDDELTWESAGEKFLEGFMQDNLGMVIGGDLASEMLSAIFTGEQFGDIEAPGVSQLSTILQEIVGAANSTGQVVRDAYDVAANGGNALEYLRRHSGDIIGGIHDTAQTAAMYLGGLPAGNLEAYLLGTVRWISPEIATAYEDALETADKTGLKGMTGDGLKRRMEDLLENRLGRADEETAAELAALYEAGHAKAAPADTPKSISVGGESRTLSAYQQQLYDTVWRETVGEALDELVQSEAYQGADAAAREKMLAKLYDYGAARAKRELFEEYEYPSWAEYADTAARSGIGTSDWAAAYAAVSEIRNDKTLSSYQRGVAGRDVITKTSLTDSKKLELYKAVYGEDGKNRAEKFKVLMDEGLSWKRTMEVYDKYAELDEDTTAKAADKATDFHMWLEDEKLKDSQIEAIEEQLKYWSMMPGKSNGKVVTAREYGIEPDTYDALKEAISEIDTNGNTSQDEAEEAINTLPGLTDWERAVLWQLQNKSWKPEKNPFDVKAGKEIYEKMHEDEGQDADEPKGLSLPRL